MWITKSQEHRKYVLGGLFPIHKKGDGSNSCGEIMKEKGIQRMEAMLYAIEEINKKKDYWGFTLEANILDTCSSDSHALNESLKFLTRDCSPGASQKVVGVIGASNSPVSESVATIFRLFQIPQISYASTSPELDDVHKYPYFFRVVPSDLYQVIAIADLLQKLNWTYVSTVESEGEYGENAVRELQEHITSHNIDVCFGEKLVIRRDDDYDGYKVAVRRLLRNQRAKAVVVFLNEDKLRKLLSAAHEVGASNGRLFWLGSDSWGTKERVTNQIENVAVGAITILPMQVRVPAEFDDYFTTLKPEQHLSKNHWFREFWESHFECSLDSDPRNKIRCSDRSLKENYTQEGLVPMVIDAVEVMAHGLKNLCAKDPDACPNGNEPPAGNKLKNYIADVFIRNSKGRGMPISFDSNRSVPVNYTIYQFKKNESGSYEFSPIGFWTKDGLTLKATKIDTKPSTCSEPCKPGWERDYKSKSNKCCWECHKCQKGHYVPSPKSRCMPCKEGFILSENAMNCLPAEPLYFGKDLNSAWSTVPLVFSIIGAIFCVIMYMTFWIYHNTPIIMASGRELCHLIFLGAFLCYCFTFVMVAEPTAFRCGLARVGLGLGLTICYSAIFTKTNRISRIFNRTMRSAKRPRYVTPKSQLVICLCLVLIELTLSAIWLLLEPPKVDNKMMGASEPYFMLCDLHDETVCLALCFSVLLILLCTYYAYKTRKIPENFNEAKYISFVMYSTCIIWMAFVPTYFALSSGYQVRSTLLTMGVSLSGTVALVCIFVPKLYIAVFQPQKNVRFPTTTNSATAAYSGPVRFVKTAVTCKTLPPETKLCDVDKRLTNKNDTKVMNQYETPETLTLDKRKVSQV